MKTIHFHGIEFYKLTKKEKRYFIKNYFDTTRTPIESKKVPGLFIYHLTDGRLLYDLTSLVVRLFNSKEDYQYYRRTLDEISTKEEQRVRGFEIQDDKFIEKLDFYLSSFESKFNLKLDFTDVSSMKKLDKLLDSLDEKKVIEHKKEIVAVIGHFFLVNCPNLKWLYYGGGASGTAIPVLKVGNFFIDPTLIYNALIFYRGKKRKKSIISKYVNSYLYYYNLSQKT